MSNRKRKLMKWIEAKIAFDHSDNDLAADLISNVFYDIGLQGVAVDDPEIEPEEDWAEDAIGRPAQHAVTGYIHQDSRTEVRCKILQERLRQLRHQLRLVYRISYRELDEQDWAHAWKAYFWPRKIGARLVVKPTWRDYRAAAEDIVIELDPGMAFGTGTHPTTALCLNMIEKYLSKGDSFLDVGTGSGILMIAAAKLGAGRLCGVDKDEVALGVAAENLKLNRVGPQTFHLTAGDLGAQISGSFNFVVANIYSHVILKLLDDVPRLLTAGGIFVGSGIIRENKNAVLAAMEKLKFEILETAGEEEWVAIAGRLPAESKGHG
jgi:ribosomal protein L11 methyltransferase